MDASGIRKIWQMAAGMQDPVNFSIGEPDFDAPDEVKQAAIEAIEQGNNGYTLTTGYQPLRDAIAADISAKYGWTNPQVIITCGVSGGLNLSLSTLVNPGDEVLVPDPYFVMYKQLINMLGGNSVFIDTYPDFQLTAERLQSSITDSSRVMLLNSPANPSGVVYTPENLQDIAEVARKNELIVLSDEIYADFSYDTPAASIASWYENTLIRVGFSKAYGIPGIRVGWIVGPADVVGDCWAQHDYITIGPNKLSDIMARTAVEPANRKRLYDRTREILRQNLKSMQEWLDGFGGFFTYTPHEAGAFYFVKYASEVPSLELVRNILHRQSTLIIPGSHLGMEGFLRIWMGGKPDFLQEGRRRIGAEIEKLPELVRGGDL